MATRSTAKMPGWCSGRAPAGEVDARNGHCSRMLWGPLAVSGARRGRVSVGSSNGRGRQFDRGTWGNRWQRGPSRRSWPIAALASSRGRTERSTSSTAAPSPTSTHFVGANGFLSRPSRARRARALVASGSCRARRHQAQGSPGGFPQEAVPGESPFTGGPGGVPLHRASRGSPPSGRGVTSAATPLLIWSPTLGGSCQCPPPAHSGCAGRSICAQHCTRCAGARQTRP